MEKKNKVGYEAFAAWEVTLARGKAKGLVGKHGFTYEDVPDLEQELLLEIHLKRGVRESWSEITASPKTVMDRILNNRIRGIIDSVEADKRRINIRASSLSDEVGDDESSNHLALEEVIGDDHALTRRGRRSRSADDELTLAISMGRGSFNDRQQQICDLLMQGFSIVETANAMGMKRTTLNDEIKRMRKLFYQQGLQEYV